MYVYKHSHTCVLTFFLSIYICCFIDLFCSFTLHTHTHTHTNSHRHHRMHGSHLLRIPFYPSCHEIVLERNSWEEIFSIRNAYIGSHSFAFFLLFYLVCHDDGVPRDHCRHEIYGWYQRPQVIFTNAKHIYCVLFPYYIYNVRFYYAALPFIHSAYALRDSVAYAYCLRVFYDFVIAYHPVDSMSLLVNKNSIYVLNISI